MMVHSVSAGDCGCQKKLSDLLALDLHMVVSSRVDAEREMNLRPLQGQQVLLNADSSLQPLVEFLKPGGSACRVRFLNRIS